MSVYNLRLTDEDTRYSFVARCSAAGFDVWTMDHEGYGDSPPAGGRAGVLESVAELDAAVNLIHKLTGQSRIDMYGHSSGALRAARYAQERPENIRRLVLDAFVWTGAGSVALAERRERMAEWGSRRVRTIGAEDIRDIFIRDYPDGSEEAVINAVVQAQMRQGTEVPSGTFIDMCTALPIVDPEKIPASCMIVRGEHDRIASMKDLTEFFLRLPAGDKRFVQLKNAGHMTFLSKSYNTFYQALFDFLA